MPTDPSTLTAHKRAGYFAGNLVIRTLLGAVLLIPYRWRIPAMGWLISRVIGPLAGYPQRIRNNLALTCPDLPRAEVDRLCRAVPDNAGRTLIEIYSGKAFIDRALRTTPEGPGLAALEAARAMGQPVFLASGHFGNYNVARVCLRPRGFDSGALYRRMANPYFNEHYLRAMKQTGETMFEQGPQGIRAMVRHLKSGGIVAILHDLFVHGGAPLQFFGQTAHTSLVTAQLALKHNALIIPVYVIRQENGLDFRLILNAPIPHTDAETMTQALNDDLEEMVRAHMDQWFWIHKRWKGATPAPTE
jgi:KDO2-lipid IV(A) lauroyltransferase